MKIDMSKELYDTEGKNIKTLDGTKNATLGSACSQALFAVTQGENPSGQEKYDRYVLAIRVKEAKGPIDLTVEEVSKIKKITGNVYPPLIVGRIWDALEGKD